MQNAYISSIIQAHRFECFPLKWEQIFTQQGPLAVEIGFGNGEFLIDWAATQKQWNFVGIERSMQAIAKIQKRVLKNNIVNIKILHCDARFAMREFFSEHSVRHIIMNFPDPWPKKCHQERRLLDSRFVNLLSAVLEKEGEYELITDQEQYAKQACRLLEETASFTVYPLEQNPLRNITTKYEKKWRQLGRSNYRVIAKNKQTDRTIHRLLQECAMPHSFIERSILPEDIEALKGWQYTEGDKLCVVKSCFKQLGQHQFLLHVIAKDGDYQQSFYVLIKRQQKDHWLVKLDPGCQPYRTPAVKMAVWEIGNLLNRDSAVSLPM